MPSTLQSVRGSAQLAFEALAGIAGSVERMHETIALRPLPWARDPADMERIVPAKSPGYRQLDVSILHHLIIDRLLGIRMETHKLGLNIEYIKDADDDVKRVAYGTAEIIFLMNPTKVTEVRDVAAAGERMPQKATYFYPKLLSGLVMNVIE